MFSLKGCWFLEVAVASEGQPDRTSPERSSSAASHKHQSTIVKSMRKSYLSEAQINITSRTPFWSLRARITRPPCLSGKTTILQPSILLWCPKSHPPIWQLFTTTGIKPSNLWVRTTSTLQGQPGGKPVPHVSSKPCQALESLLRVQQALRALKQPCILGKEKTSVIFQKELCHTNNLVSAIENHQQKSPPDMASSDAAHPVTFHYERTGGTVISHTLSLP